MGKQQSQKAKGLLRQGYHALLWREGTLFVAKCVEIEVASQGKTKNEALNNLQEALDLFLEDVKGPAKTPVMRDVELRELPVTPLYA